MDGASSVPPTDPSMDDPNDMGGAPADPAMEDPNAMGEDPSMEGPTMDEPNDMGGAGAEDMGEDGGDSTMDIINQLSDTDREAVRAYAESMLNRDESQNGNDDEEDMGGAPAGPAMEDPNAGGAPMMESFIFTKAQIRRLNENFGPTEDELSKERNKNKKPLGKKNGQKTVSKKSPFNSPKFK